MKNIKKELKELKLAFGFATTKPCTQEENQAFKGVPKKELPEGVAYNDYEDVFVKYEETEISAEDKKEFYRLKQLSYLKSIKNSLKFFVVLTIISLIVSLILVLAGAGAIDAFLNF